MIDTELGLDVNDTLVDLASYGRWVSGHSVDMIREMLMVYYLFGHSFQHPTKPHLTMTSFGVVVAMNFPGMYPTPTLS